VRIPAPYAIIPPDFALPRLLGTLSRKSAAECAMIADFCEAKNGTVTAHVRGMLIIDIAVLNAADATSESAPSISSQQQSASAISSSPSASPSSSSLLSSSSSVSSSSNFNLASSLCFASSMSDLHPEQYEGSLFEHQRGNSSSEDALGSTASSSLSSSFNTIPSKCFCSKCIKANSSVLVEDESRTESRQICTLGGDVNSVLPPATTALSTVSEQGHSASGIDSLPRDAVNKFKVRLFTFCCACAIFTWTSSYELLNSSLYTCV
jgi:hypothetical protein